MKSVLSIFRIILFLFLVGLVAVGYISFVKPRVDERKELVRQRDEIKAANEEKQRAIAEVTRKATDFQTKDEYPEITARRDGYAKGSETVYDFSGSK